MSRIVTTQDPEVLAFLKAIGIDINALCKVIVIIDRGGPVKIISTRYLKKDGYEYDFNSIQRLDGTLAIIPEETK